MELSFSPAEIAARYADSGVAKTKRPTSQLIVLGLLAALLSYGIIAWVYSKLASLFSFGISFSPLTFSDVWAVLLVGFLVIGMLTGIAGSAISMTKYLKDEGGSQS